MFFGFFVAIIVTFPLILHPHSLFLLHERLGELRVGDQFVFIQYLADASDALHHLRPIWPIVYQNPNFAMSPMYVFFGGIMALFTSPVFANNSFLIFCVFAAFITMFFYIRMNSGSLLSATYGAFLFSASNYMIHHIMDGHGNLVAIFWIPIIFLTLEKTVTESGWKYPAIFSISLLGTYVSCEHYFLYLSFLLPIYVLIAFPGKLKNPEVLMQMGGALLVSLVFIAVLIFCRAKQMPALYSNQDALMFSLHSWKELIQKNTESRIGLSTLFLALLGILQFFNLREKRGAAILVLAVFSVILMMGPFYKFSPYSILEKIIYPLTYTRTPVRLVVFLLFFTAILAAKGFSYIETFCKNRYSTFLAVAFIIFLCAVDHQGSMYWNRTPKGDFGIWTYYFKDDYLRTMYLKKKLLMEGKA